MTTTRRWRLACGAGLLTAAGAVGVVGWYRLSGTPYLNEQVPYLASAGLAVVVLAVAGGSLLVAEQMRTDDRRLDDLEDAVRTLIDVLAPLIEDPARRKHPVATRTPTGAPRASARGRPR